MKVVVYGVCVVMVGEEVICVVEVCDWYGNMIIFVGEYVVVIVFGLVYLFADRLFEVVDVRSGRMVF